MTYSLNYCYWLFLSHQINKAKEKEKDIGHEDHMLPLITRYYKVNVAQPSLYCGGVSSLNSSLLLFSPTIDGLAVRVEDIFSYSYIEPL